MFRMPRSVGLTAEERVLLFFITCVFLAGAVVKCEISCATFEFLSNYTGELIVEEGSTINMTFHLKNRTCRNLENPLIHLSYLNAQNYFDPWCNIQQKKACNGLSGTDFSCTCLPTPGFYSFVKTVVRSDSKLWRWSTSDKKLTPVEIKFNVTYYPRLNSLSLNGHKGPTAYTVQRNENVRIVCSWENGNPRTSVRLTDNRGNLLLSSFDDGNVTHFIYANCLHSGVIQCKAENFEASISQMLVVQCPPTLESRANEIIEVENGASAQHHFPFLSHTQNIEKCYLVHIQTTTINNEERSKASYNAGYNCSINSSVIRSRNESKSISEKCLCNFSGTVPDMKLTLHVYDIKSSESGLWQVVMNNNIGSGQVDIYLFVKDAKNQSNEKWKDVFIYLVLLSLVVVTVTGVVISIFIYRWKRLSNNAGNLISIGNRLAGSDVHEAYEHDSSRETGTYSLDSQISALNSNAFQSEASHGESKADRDLPYNNCDVIEKLPQRHRTSPHSQSGRTAAGERLNVRLIPVPDKKHTSTVYEPLNFTEEVTGAEDYSSLCSPHLRAQSS